MTQKEWELETRIKQLEGSDLESIVSEFNNKIDSIVNKAVFKLDSLKLEFKLRDNTQKKKKILESYIPWYALANDCNLSAKTNCNNGLGFANTSNNNLTGIGASLLGQTF